MPLLHYKKLMKTMMMFIFMFIIVPLCFSYQAVPTWKKVTLPQSIMNGYFLDVFFLPTNPTFGWACGFDGQIALTTDGGSSWNASIIQGRPFLESIHFVDEKHGFTSGPGGVFKTTDGGLNWIDLGLRNFGSQIWGCYFSDKDNGIFVGGGCSGTEQIFGKTTDAGGSWTFYAGSENESGMADVILYSKNGLGFAVSSGLLWQTLNGGDTWNVFASIAGPRAWAEEITHVKNSFLTPFSGDDCFGGLRDYGGANFTTDNGKSWNVFTTNKSMFGSFLLDDKRGWICGDKGEVLSTTNAGLNWERHNCGLDGANIDDVWFVNDSIGWGAGQGIFKFSYTKLPESFINAPPMPYCAGDTVVLTVSNEFNNILWSTGGNSGSSTTVTKNTSVIVRANHIPTCTIVYDTLKVVFNPPVKAKLNISTDTILCENADIMIKVEGTYDSLNWFDGSNVKQRIFDRTQNPSGFYVDVFDSLKCSKRLVIPNIIWSNAFKPTIQNFGKAILCNSDSTELQAPKGFRSYLWSNGETNRTVTIKEPGQYHAILIDSLGCTYLSDTITIGKVDLDNFLSTSISGKKVLLFDTTVIGSKTCIELTFTNKNPFSEYLLELPFIKRNIQFSMPSSQFPMKIKPLDSLTLNVCFSPDSIGLWKDTMMFRDTCSSLVYPLIGYAIPFEINDVFKCGLHVKSAILSNGEGKYFQLFPHPIMGLARLVSPIDIAIYSIELYDIYGKSYQSELLSDMSRKEHEFEVNVPSGLYVPFIHSSIGTVQMNPVVIIR
ncbi:hypothetical protein EBV26_02840 [bacterium]|nr:hypothetical protein [bacterium]